MRTKRLWCLATLAGSALAFLACRAHTGAASMAFAGHHHHSAGSGTGLHPPGRTMRYAAIGASDTVGLGTARPHEEGWVPRFHETLPPGTELLNLGVSGTIASHAVRHQLPRAAAFDPDIATVWLAVNDLNARVPVDGYRRDLDTIVSGLRNRGAVVLLGNVPDLTRVPIYQLFGHDLVRREVARFNSAIAEVAQRHGAVLVDIHGKWHELAAHPEYVGLDGFHPSASGYSRLAQVFAEAYQAAVHSGRSG